jgi:aminopeptidase N
MLESYVGAETFKIINAYLQARLRQRDLEDPRVDRRGVGVPVERILLTFVNQPGPPLLDVSIACANNQTAVTLKQQRFVIDAAALDGRWQIPICLCAGPRHHHCEVMTEESRTLNTPAPARRGCSRTRERTATTGPHIPPSC